jgi:uncharacterized sulfatase
MKDSKPNIILITVDELRYPMHFPKDPDTGKPIKTAGRFLELFMPNLYNYLWEDGVKFSNYQTAGCACSPARGAMITGLYGQQTGLLATRANLAAPNSSWAPQPYLRNVFPTYGKLLKHVGYSTPFIGKWHVSNAPNRNTSVGPDSDDQTRGVNETANNYLNEYGFDGYSLPDPCGLPGQGVGEMKPNYQKENLKGKPDGEPENFNDTQLDDSQIAAQAVAWLKAYANSNSKVPFCLTVGFLNPHDKQFYWGGTEWEKFDAAYKELTEQEPYLNYNATPKLANPDDHGYNDVPVNYQTEYELKKKPSLQTAVKNCFGYLTGGISEVRTGYFTAANTGCYSKTKVAKKIVELKKINAPYSYWQRALDMYTQVMTDVDVQLGTLLSQIPESLKKNTVIVFTTDHGDYASSHGMQGKAQTVYRESYNIPLIVKELFKKKSLTSHPDIIRDQLASSIDLVPMLVSIGNGGNMDWIKNKSYKEKFHTEMLYGHGKRFDLLKIVKDPDAEGRRFAAFTSDEIFTNQFNPEIEDGNIRSKIKGKISGKSKRAPIHVIGCVFDEFKYSYKGKPFTLNGKFGFYYDRKQPLDAKNKPVTSKLMAIEKNSIELEYYDYKDEDSRLEMNMDNDEPGSPMEAMISFVTEKLIPEQIQGQMPANMEKAQAEALVQYWVLTNLGNMGSDEGDEATNFIMAGHFVN